MLGGLFYEPEVYASSCASPVVLESVVGDQMLAAQGLLSFPSGRQLLQRGNCLVECPLVFCRCVHRGRTMIFSSLFRDGQRR